MTAPVDLEQFREAVECWRDAIKTRAASVANERAYYSLAERIAEADRLLSIIDSVGKVGVDASFAEWLAKEMPAGTVIGDPAWWADRIARQYSKRTAQQPAAVVDDARMARALEWVRQETEGCLGRREHLPSIEEAIAAYDPSCGARTVRVVDEAVVERDTLRGLIEELLDTELADLACAGSMAPVEDVIGRMQAALARVQGVQP